jgi:primosomal protein N' (replication factor Y)
MQTPKICPHCNSGYIKFSGLGTEKVESELCRIFPQARIRRTDEKRPFDINDVDILISTQSIFRTQGYKFNLVGVLAIDNSLNRVDLRASEKTFALLIGLLVLAKEKLVIQTRLPQHHIFEALIKRDLNIFYNKELKQRKQLKFSPYVHMVSVKLRAKKEDMVEEAARRLFERLKERNKDKAIKFLSVNPAQPRKLRGNFYWDVLIISRDIKKVNRFLKINLKDFAHSGIIVTVDVDPT